MDIQNKPGNYWKNSSFSAFADSTRRWVAYLHLIIAHRVGIFLFPYSLGAKSETFGMHVLYLLLFVHSGGKERDGGSKSDRERSRGHGGGSGKDRIDALGRLL